MSYNIYLLFFFFNGEMMQISKLQGCDVTHTPTATPQPVLTTLLVLKPNWLVITPVWCVSFWADCK